MVETGEAELTGHDFIPFQSVAGLPVAGMTAHVVFSAFDPSQPATLSASVICDVIRGLIGFEGLLLSDDLGMKALTGSFTERASGCLKAGCDIALHCSGDLDEMEQVAAGSSLLSERALASITPLDAVRGRPRVEIDRTAVAFEVASLLEAAA